MTFLPDHLQKIATEVINSRGNTWDFKTVEMRLDELEDLFGSFLTDGQRKWIKNEKEGTFKEDDLPDYRKIRASILFNRNVSSEERLLRDCHEFSFTFRFKTYEKLHEREVIDNSSNLISIVCSEYIPLEPDYRRQVIFQEHHFEDIAFGIQKEVVKIISDILTKHNVLIREEELMKVQIENINGNSQVGNNNIMIIADIRQVAQQIGQHIDASNGTEEQKTEAKGLLRRIAEHPTANTVLGALLANPAVSSTTQYIIECLTSLAKQLYGHY